MAFEALKEKQSAVWGSGPYERISDHLAIAHEHLMRVVGPRGGERWLDVATGTGEVAVMAARAGAEVTAQDLAPALIDRARGRARAGRGRGRVRGGGCRAASLPRREL
jgi:ubiquinone/menaquinone biosynthesis C-methylase UbiE